MAADYNDERNSEKAYRMLNNKSVFVSMELNFSVS